MAEYDRAIGRLLVTGVPGWLTTAFFESLQQSPIPGLTSVRCQVEPGRATSSFHPLQLSVPVECVVADLRDADTLRHAVDGVDTVLHTAGLLHVRRTRDWYDVNTRGTAVLAGCAADASVQRFVFISSNAAAGRAESADRLLTEEDAPRPLSHYGRSKLLAEQALIAYASRMETVVLRPCMFYGPPVPSRHIEVYKRLLTGRMPLVGGGDFARSLSYIDNLVQGVRLALVRSAASAQTYYISDSRPYTTRQISEAMASALGVIPNFVPVPRLAAPIAYMVDMALSRFQIYSQALHLVGESDWHVGVSCEKAREELGYCPQIELHEGMRRAVEWCRQNGKLSADYVSSRSY